MTLFSCYFPMKIRNDFQDRTLENATYSYPWLNTFFWKSIPMLSNVWPWLLLIVMGLNNFESLSLKWKETMYPSLSCVYPFDPFLSLSIYNHSNFFESLYFYPSESNTYPHTSFSIFHLSTSIFFYRPSVYIYPFLFSTFNSLIPFHRFFNL